MRLPWEIEIDDAFQDITVLPALMEISLLDTSPQPLQEVNDFLSGSDKWALHAQGSDVSDLYTNVCTDYLHIYLSIYLPTYLSICPFIQHKGHDNAQPAAASTVARRHVYGAQKLQKSHKDFEVKKNCCIAS